MSQLKLAASQPAITTWLSGVLETLIQLEIGSNVAHGVPASVLVLKACQAETAVPLAMAVSN